MDYTELLTLLNLSKREIHATIINPIRKGDSFKRGQIVGFKGGIVSFGKHKKGEEDNSYPKAIRWFKKPRVLLLYPIITIFPKNKHFCDWVDVDNCDFSVVENS